MKSQKPLTPTSRSRDSLRSLDIETFIDMFLSLEEKYQQLGDFVRELVIDKYGKKSERFEAPGQLSLLEAAGNRIDVQSSQQATETTNTASRASQRSKSGHSRNELPADLPRIPVIAPPPPAADLICDCCKQTKTPLRRILQHSRYQFIPASFHIEELYSVVYGCINCSDSKQKIVRVPETVKNGLAAPGLLAQIAVARDFDHLPFNRQCAIYQRNGVSLSRSTLCDMYSNVANILSPLYRLMHEILLESKVISTDDTPVKVLDRTREKNIKLGRKWAYLGDNEHPVNLFDYTEGRGRDGPLTFLRHFDGYLQGDCFSGNLAVCASKGTILVACLAHARRYFIKAILNDKNGCNQALTMFQALYEIEHTAKELNLSTRDLEMMREQESIPLLEKFHKWLQYQFSFVPPKNSFGKALFYCLNNWTELCQYVKDGALSIDNNHCEPEMKYIAMGRNAWLFFGSDQGGRDHAIVLSILSTCRRHGVEPWVYLTDVIERLTENPSCDLQQLLPYNWKPKIAVQQITEMTVVKDTPKALCA
jgi:transposase